MIMHVTSHDMEREGMASVWLGRAKSKETLEAFLRMRHTDGGDVILSPFALAYGIDDHQSPHFHAVNASDEAMVRFDPVASRPCR
jgi:hypothetical protein